MSGNFNKALDPYESNNKPEKGKYHFDIPHDIEPACYTMDIDYESHDELHPDAYQYKGYIVVGHQAYLKTNPIIIPFNTSANSEEAVTLYEKRNTAFNIIAEAFSDTELSTGIKELPLYVRFAKGLFRDYYANENTAKSVISSDFNDASESSTITLPVKTNNNGKSTTNIKVSDIYSIEENINDINTLFFKCKGTRDRGTDNYVPVIIEAPLIIGTTHIDFNRHTSTYIHLAQEDVPFQLESDPQILPATCGTGEVQLGASWIYRFSLNEQSQSKKHYEQYITDPTLHCKVGGMQLEYNAGNGWVKAEARELTPVSSATTVLNDGTIIHTPNNLDSNGVDVIWTNPLSSSTSKMISWRWKYIGKPGATFSRYSPNYRMAIDPSLGTPTCVDTELIITNPSNGVLTATYNVPFTITGQIVEIGTNTRVNDNGGSVSVTIGDDTYTGTVNNGAFSIEVPNDRVGSYSGNIVYTPGTSAYVESNEVIGVNVSQQQLDIINIVVDSARNTKAAVSGKIVKIGTNTAIGGGNITLTVNGSTSTVPVASDGTFTVRTQNNISSNTTGTLSLAPVTNNYVCSDKTVNINIPVATTINVLPSSVLDIHYFDEVEIYGNVTYESTVHDDVAGIMEITVNNVKHTVNMTGARFSLNISELPVGTYTAQFNYKSPDTSKFENSTTTAQIKVNPADIYIGVPTSTKSIWDSGASDSESFGVSIENEIGENPAEGVLKLYMKPTSSSYSVDPIEVWSKKITSAANSWTLNSYSDLDFRGVFSAMLDINRVKYTNYQIIGKYIPSTTKYAETTQNGGTFRYRCKTPKIQIIGQSSFIDSSATHRHSLQSTHTFELSSFTNGTINETTWNNLGDSNRVTLRVISASDGNSVINGIPHFWWFTSSSETFDVYKTDDTGAYILDDNNNRIYATDEYYKDANGSPTNVPLHPCLPGYPVPMRFGKRTPNSDRTGTTIHTYEWLGGDASGNSDSISLYFVFDRYLANIFPDIENTITNPYKVVTGENPSTSTYSVVAKINLKMSH